MSNVPILSNTTSALFNTLSENSDIDPYLYRLNQPWPNNSKSKIHVLPNQPMNFNSQTTFRIPRFGLLQAAAIKVQIDLGPESSPNADGLRVFPTAVTSTQKNISSDFALFLCSRIALVSHTREIEVLTPYGSLAKYYALPREQQIALSDAMQRGFDPRGGGDLMNVLPAKQPQSNGIANGLEGLPAPFDINYKDQSIITYYIPLLFSFGAHLGSALDSSFLEELEIVCDVSRQQDLMGLYLLPATRGEAPNVVNMGATIKSAELLCYFHNLPNKEMRALQNSQYNLKSSQPLTVLYSNCFEETPVSFDPGFGANQSVNPHGNFPAIQDNFSTVTINLSCKHLIYQTIVACELDVNKAYGENDVALRGTGTQADIVSAELFMSGRSVWKTTSIESCCLEAGLLHGCNPRARDRGITGAQNNLVDTQNDTRTLTISWTNDMRKALAEMTGALSLKGASTPQLVLTIRPVVASWTQGDGFNRPTWAGVNQTSTHTVYITHLYYSATSFSGADGRISQGLNL